MSPKTLSGVFAAALGLATVWAPACSSSSTNPPGPDSGPDAGAARDSSMADTGASRRDSSVVIDSTVAQDSSIGDSSAAPPDSSVSADASDAVAACMPASTAGFKPSTYTDATEHQGACDANATAAFIAACGAAGTTSTCGAWKAANLASDAGPVAGTACGNCIVAPLNNGGAWADPRGILSPNYGGCVQILAPINGSTCAAAFNAAHGCEGVACDNACPGAAYAGCAKAADIGSCSTFAAADEFACTPLQSLLTMCQPSSVSGNPDDDLRFVIGLVCGPAGDGGVSDSGTGDTGVAHDTGTTSDTGTMQD